MFSGKTDLTKVPTYVVTPDSAEDKWFKRRKHMMDLFNRRKFKDYFFLKGIVDKDKPVQGCTMTQMAAGLKGLQQKPFKPFLILEDDAQDMADLELKIRVPKDADAVWLGICTGGVEMAPSANNPYTHRWDGNYFSVTADPDIVRVYNMLSAHAVLIHSEQFARNWVNCCAESIMRDAPFDVFVGLTMSHFNVYARLYPLFYQNEIFAGQEQVTNAVLTGKCITGPEEFDLITNHTRPECTTHMINTLGNGLFKAVNGYEIVK